MLRPHLAKVHWEGVVGPQVAGVTQVEFVRDGVLFVRVKNSVWANELTLLKEDMLRRLNSKLGGRILTDIHFKASRLGRREKKIGKNFSPSAFKARVGTNFAFRRSTGARGSRTHRHYGRSSARTDSRGHGPRRPHRRMEAPPGMDPLLPLRCPRPRPVVSSEGLPDESAPLCDLCRAGVG